MKLDFLIIGSYGGGAVDHDANLARAFERAGYTAAVASHWQPAHEALIARSVRSFDLETPMRATRLAMPLPEAVRQMESRLKIPSLRDFCFPEACYTFLSEKELFQRAVRTFLVTEDFFDQHEIGAFIAGPGAEIAARCFREIARQRGVPFVYMGAALNLFPDRMFLHTEERTLLETYSHTPYEDIPEVDRSAVRELLQGIRGERKVVTFRNQDISSRALGRLQTVLSHFRSRNWHRLHITVRFYLHNRILAAIRGLAARVLYRRFDPDVPYVFFPLHLYNDSQISVRNPHLFQQTWIVEYMARSLPQDYKLYVKGHPGCPQDRLRNLAAMARLPNVVLLNPSVNAHKVAGRARAVAVINSTAGAEALIHRKPVIALGNWEMKHLGVTFDVDDMSKLTDVVARAINSPPIDDNTLCSVIYSVRRAMYPGNIFSPDYDIIVASLIRKASLNTGRIPQHAASSS